MGVSGGPKIIQDSSLILDLDASDAVNNYRREGRIWNDLSGNNNSGNITNGAALNNDSYGSFSFNGINSYIKVLSNASLQPTTTLTVECAFKRNSGRTILSYSTDNAGSAKSYCFEYSSVFRGILSTSVSSYTLSGPNIDANTWYYAALTYDGSLASLYINGSLSTSTPASGTITYAGSSNLNLGRKNDGDGEYISGSIGLTRIYNRSLSVNEIQSNYNQFQSRFSSITSNIITYVTLNQATAIGIFNDGIEFSNIIVGYPSYASANALVLPNESTI